MSANAHMSVACERCGASFHVKPSRMERYNTRFCSRACRTTSGDPAYFWARIDVRGPDECWPWKAGKRMSAEGRGYGVAFFDGKHEQAHRVAFRLAHGHWPAHGRHSCDNPPCCNPAHILDGTHADNMRDAVERGRRPKGEATPQAKLTEADIRAIRADRRIHVLTAKDYGVHPAHVSRIRARKIWRHV